jgi:squalene-hopene/tetraprenyl-beta-curcumene cyclase
LRKLLILKDESGYCQPCMSPVWDTGLAALALMEAETPRDGANAARAMNWLAERQVLDVAGDWTWQRPGLRPGGWAFQYANPHYPDVDDTALVGMALDRAGDPAQRETIERAAEWIIGMQSANGGWGSFDADNTKFYLNHIPFADHGALLDPPTADVSARCLGFLAQLGYKAEHPTIARAIQFLKREQEADGSWFGRWGTNYVYGTWSVLCALNAVHEDPQQPYIRRAVEWLKGCQREDGGWGEDGATYWRERRGECKASTPSQTAWALLALMAAGEADSDAVKRGIAHLLEAPREGCAWQEPWFTAVGFPRVFYLRYHGYCRFFPLWALARYRNLMHSNDKTVHYGI